MKVECEGSKLAAALLHIVIQGLSRDFSSNPFSSQLQAEQTEA